MAIFRGYVVWVGVTRAISRVLHELYHKCYIGYITNVNEPYHVLYEPYSHKQKILNSMEFCCDEGVDYGGKWIYWQIPH